MKTVFITNARAGRKRDQQLLHGLIEEHYGADGRHFTIEPCSAKEQLDELIPAAIRNGVELVFAVGGDGTVSEIGRRLIDTNLVLGILPVGSGNGLARHLGIPLNVTSALRASLTGKVTRLDTATVNEHPFLGIAGVGFDALVAERFAASKVRGLQTYVKESLLSIGSYKAIGYDIVVDGRRLHTRAFLITVANSNQYGNDVKIAPLASLQDGLLDVTVVGDAPLLSAPLILGQLLLGQIQDSSHVTSFRGKRVEIVRESAGPAHVDGEPIFLPEKLLFTINPASLSVLVPRSMRKL
ncbi:MAG TPA: YegS/Rv2252/BmrU family lipid kinase [Thermoanaerobaculia bacterium]|nr:YegS/Rv2252/BmrU family lipid kinase [Thermoanaerobaculia bacterium]